MEAIGFEMRLALRRLVRTPAFTLPALVTLALAVGANAALFGLVHRVVLNPLPYPDSHRLIALDFGMPIRNVSSGINSIPSRIYYQLRERAGTLDGVAIYRSDEVNLAGGASSERVRVVRATASLASVLRVTPAQGRWFTGSEDVPGTTPVAVMSHGLWVRRYREDPAVLGQVVRLDGVPTTIVGIMPSSFAFPDSRVEMWTPVSLTPARASDTYVFRGIARLGNAVTLADARTEMTSLTRALDAAYPANGYAQLVSTPSTLLDATVGRIAQTLWILLASAGVVLLIAGANVGNLFLVRSEVRQREVMLRRALGAETRAMARYFLSESVLLSAAGGTFGLALAWSGLRILVASGPPNLPRLHEVGLDAVGIAFAAVVSLLTAVVLGSMQLLRLSPRPLALHEAGRGSTPSRARHRTRHVLMGAQVALALLLVIASGLMLRSFRNMLAVDPGFDPASTLTFRIGLPQNSYPGRAEFVRAHQALIDRLSVVPGVRSVSAATCLPLAEQVCPGGPLFVDGRPLPHGSSAPFVRSHAVADGYFAAMSMHVVRGRGLERRDIEREEPVAVINEALATAAFPNDDPIGQRVRFGNPSLAPDAPEWLTVVGVVANTPYDTLTEVAPVPQVFMPTFAERRVNMAPRLDAMSYVLRAEVAPEALVMAVRTAIGGVDSGLGLAQVRTLEDILDRASAQMAFTMALLSIAAGVALVLGIVGIHGVMSYVVTQRTPEMGIRLALGASPASVARTIVLQGAGVASCGVLVGLLAAWTGSRVMASLLYGVSPRDPVIFATTTGLVVGVALMACWVPARRAAKLSPLEALR